MYQKPVIKEADAHVRVLDASRPDKDNRGKNC